MPTAQGSGLEGCPQLRGLDQRGAHSSGAWIRGVSTVSGPGLDGFPQFRGLD